MTTIGVGKGCESLLLLLLLLSSELSDPVASCVASGLLACCGDEGRELFVF